MKYLFPAANVALSIGAAVVYFAQGDWKHGTYFLLGALITIIATAM